ncbi:S8 family serine peptidase [uncultured Imperialibacter sp.]|uniref:S8 family peptidase n=1 Tax=uncultured Imperialibacter sp. TaxID=1672639 RepID=UPI0030DC45C6|tara:strand:- start:53245 stop:54384 length:1140 start_codon:yes stop_codon:yes gene_type:complete
MKPQDRKIGLVDRPTQFKQLQRKDGLKRLIEVDNLVRASAARHHYQVFGKGLTVAVLDTGLRSTHDDFKGRVVGQVNFTPDNTGNINDASDGHGHGTNVSGIISAGTLHTGIAPLVNIVPIKVLQNNGGGHFGYVDQALEWIRQNPQYKISVICMSLGDTQNHLSDQYFNSDTIRSRIADLATQNVATIIAAGNEYFTYQSMQGMAYPAIFREAISVGAVYDSFQGSFTYHSGAQVIQSGPDRITPFSQRLHPSKNTETYTTVFAPGAPVTSSGILNDQAESVQHGTSQAAPVVAGIVILIQEYFLRLTGYYPPISFISKVLRYGGTNIFDGDDEYDNVHHTGQYYLRADALGALSAVDNLITKEMYLQGKDLKSLSLS